MKKHTFSRNLRAQYKKLYRRFIRLRGNPREIALGFALGIFIGMSPTMGIQIITAVLIAALLKWNKIAASIGVLVTNAFTAPLIYAGTYLIGARVLGLQGSFELPKEANLETVLNWLEKAPEIFGAMAIGGIIVGLPLAVAAYFASFHVSTLYQHRRDKVKATVE